MRGFFVRLATIRLYSYSMELVDIKIQLDNLRLAVRSALDNNRNLSEITKLHNAIQKKKMEIVQHLPISN